MMLNMHKKCHIHLLVFVSLVIIFGNIKCILTSISSYYVDN
jgi:hypothetical protein